MLEMNPNEYDNGWDTKWDDMKEYGPFSRHLRRLIGDLIHPLVFETVLDVGCGQGSFLAQLRAKFPQIKPTGVDISVKAIELARLRVPEGQFQILDIARDSLDKKYDLVVCSEVLEHIPVDITAIKNLAGMTGKYLVVSAPQGRMRRFEAKVGHVRNYAYGELFYKLNQNGLNVVRVIEWGFPFYSPLYRDYLDLVGGRGTGGKFGPPRRFISNVLYNLFRANSSKRGDEIVILGEVKSHFSRTQTGDRRW